MTHKRANEYVKVSSKLVIFKVSGKEALYLMTYLDSKTRQKHYKINALY